MSEQFNWNKQIAIRVKTVGPGTIQRRQLVMVSVCVSHKAPSNLKVLSIKLTDENDPFFLFQMEIGEEEFPSLKSEQNLLVDFTNFPVKFIELLEECNRCDSSSSDCEKFIARLSVDPSGHQNNTLTIMETNTFKQIVHLSLSFTAGNDESLKKYLSGLVNVFKNECLRLKEQLVSKEQTFQNEMKALVSENLSIKQTLESCRFEYADRESRLKLQHAELQTEERMKIVNEKENELREKQRELNELISKFDKQRLELSATVRDLQSQNSALKNQKEVCEDQLSSSKSRLDSFQLELQTCKSELNKLTSETSDWKNTETNLRNSLHMNLEKIQNLEQMVADKTSKITFLEENNSR
jgi:spindle assembly abnormal protein 6